MKKIISKNTRDITLLTHKNNTRPTSSERSLALSRHSDYSSKTFDDIKNAWIKLGLPYSLDYSTYLQLDLPTQVGGTCHQYAELITITIKYNMAMNYKRGTLNPPVAFDINDYFQARNYGILSRDD